LYSSFPFSFIDQAFPMRTCFFRSDGSSYFLWVFCGGPPFLGSLLRLDGENVSLSLFCGVEVCLLFFPFPLGTRIFCSDLNFFFTSSLFLESHSQFPVLLPPPCFFSRASCSFSSPASHPKGGVSFYFLHSFSLFSPFFFLFDPAKPFPPQSPGA